MAALPALAIQLPDIDPPLNGQIASPEQLQQLLELSGVFKGHELTRKDGRIMCSLAPIDALIGGIARGRISEVTGPLSSGKTTIAAAFASAASRRGEVVGWVDVPGAFDPRSLEAAGAELARILWVSFQKKPAATHGTFITKERERRIELKAAEMLLEAGGFGLVIIDFGAMRFPLSQSASLRLARAAERSGAAVLALANTRVCGTFAALTLAMSTPRANFSRTSTSAPALFDGLRIEASVERNKLGLFGDRAHLFAAIDPLSCHPALFDCHPERSEGSTRSDLGWYRPNPRPLPLREGEKSSGPNPWLLLMKKARRGQIATRSSFDIRSLRELGAPAAFALDDRTEEQEGTTSLVALR